MELWKFELCIIGGLKLSGVLHARPLGASADFKVFRNNHYPFSLYTLPGLPPITPEVWLQEESRNAFPVLLSCDAAGRPLGVLGSCLEGGSSGRLLGGLASGRVPGDCWGSSWVAFGRLFRGGCWHRSLRDCWEVPGRVPADCLMVSACGMLPQTRLGSSWEVPGKLLELGARNLR